MEDIHFLERNDLCFGYYYEKAFSLALDNELSEFLLTEDINDIVNVYNAFRYIIYSYNNNLIEHKQKSLIDKAKGSIAIKLTQYAQKLDSTNFVEKYEQLKSYNIKDFWCYINEFKGYKCIRSCINELLNRWPHTFGYMLRYQDICNSFDKEFRNYMLSEPKTCEIIVFKHKVEGYEDINLPKSLKFEDIEFIFDKYIDSDDPYINVLAAILSFGALNGKKLDNGIILKARRKKEEIESQKVADDCFKNDYVQKVTLSETVKKPAELLHEGNEWNYVISLNFLRKHNAPVQRFHILQVILHLLDSNGLVDNVNKANEAGVLERTVLKPFRNDYPLNIACKGKNLFVSLNFRMYYDFLERQGSGIEELISFYFEEFLPNEFDIKCFKFVNPKANTFLECCRNVSVCLESILKQYKMFVETGDIDFELLSLESTVRFRDIPSFVKDKYITIVDNGLINCMNLMLSDQSMLDYQEKFSNQGKHFKNFCDFMQKETIYKQDYHEIYYPRLEYLKEHNIIDIAEDGKISYTDECIAEVFMCFFYDEVISLYHCSPKQQNLLKKWLQNGWCNSQSTLFTEPEAKYFNFFLNDKEFSNSLSLRNHYAHGSFDYKSEEEHKSNYLVLLRLFTQMVLKINDDLCLGYE